MDVRNRYVRTLSAVAVESSECDANVESGALQGGEAMVHHCVGECARVCARMCNRNHRVSSALIEK